MNKQYILTLVLLLASVCAMGQDSLWVKYGNRFKANRFLFSLEGIDSIELRASGTLPDLRRYSTSYDKGYSDYRLTGMTTSDSALLVIGDPGRICWKPTSSDNSYNNDYMDPTTKWNFKHSKESEHFIVFWDSRFGDNPNASTVPSNLRVDIDDLLKKAEIFFNTNVNRLHMVELNGPSRLDNYKMSIYLLYQTDWLATGAGNDNMVGTLWVNPSTCQPVGSTIGHEIGHSFQYQTYCDNILRGRANDYKSGFRYGYPGSNGGCGFWEQCAQWQSFQDYPSEAINSYHRTGVWVDNYNRHFEHEWQRYASYYEQYYWTEKQGITALGRIWNESVYPEDANMAYMRIFLNNNYDTLRTQLFEYAQKAATYDFDAIRAYVSTSTCDQYKLTTYATDDGWQQVSYHHCPQPTGFNVIKVKGSNGSSLPDVGKTVTFHIKGLPVGSALASGDPGNQVNGDGKTVATVTNYNTTDIAGKEGWAFGFVAYMNDGSRQYGPMNLLTTTNTEATASYTIPEGAKRVYVVVQGSPSEYRRCPWDDKETTDDQLPYEYKLD
jgi:hypothetical protein